MTKKNEFVEYLIELLQDFGSVTARAMFGGYGLYHEGLMFGLVADDTLYLKVDDQSRSTFEAEGLEPFMYVKNGKAMAMSYHQAPAEALENPREMQHWATLAYEAALRAPRKKPRKK